MATNFDSLFDTIHAGQDRRYLQQQRALQTQQQQDQATQAAASAAALPAIRQQVATGDYDGARVAAAFSGNQPIAEFVGGLQKEHQAKLSDMAGTLGSTAYALRQITDPAQRASAFQAYIPALKAHGISDTDLAAAQGNLSDGALDGYINSAQTVRQHVEDAQAQAAAAAKANAPYTLAPGEARYDASGRQIARSDFKPDVTFVDNGDGTKTRVITNLDGGGSPSASPAANGITRPERNNNPGNVRALGGGQMWRGQTGTDDGGYAIFGDLASGQRAADRNLQSYGRRGVNTIGGIISRWAPKADRNNTDQYIANVSRSLGIPANQPLDLTDPTMRQKLLTAGIYPNEGPTGRRGGAAQSSGDVFGKPTTSADGSVAGMTPQTIDLLAREGIKRFGGLVPPGYARDKNVMKAISNRIAAINAGGDVGALTQNAQDFKGAQTMITGMAQSRPGSPGGITRSLNVATDHLSLYRGAALALQNGNTPLFNKFSNAIRQQTGNPLPTNAKALAGVVADEVNKAVIGGAGAVSDRQDLKDQLSTANSPEQIRGVIDSYIGLMGGQLKGMRQQYEASTGRKDFAKYVSPHAQRLLGMTDQGAQPLRQNTPPPGASKTASGPGGKRIALVNGQWVPY